MILVDTSVMIDYLKGAENKKSLLLENIFKNNIPFGISSYTYQELLQGARDETELAKLKTYLSTQKIYFLPENLETYESAAQIYYKLRRNGKTIRSTIDILISQAAIFYDLFLLHNDNDFDIIAGIITDLKILKILNEIK